MRAFLKSPLMLALVVAVICVLSRDAQTFEQAYWNGWYKFDSIPAPHDSLIVSLDGGNADGTVKLDEQARLLDRLDQYGAVGIYIDSPAADGFDQAADAAFLAALERHADTVVLVNRAHIVKRFASIRSDMAPLHFIPPAGVQVSGSVWKSNLWGFVTRSAPATDVGGKLVPVAAIVASGRHDVPMDKAIYPDFRIDPATVLTFNASAVLAGRVSPAAIAGRKVFVTETSLDRDTVLRYFGRSKVPAALVDIAGAAQLAAGATIEIGYLPLLLVFAVLVFAAHRTHSRRIKILSYAGLIVLLVTVPGFLRDYGIVSEAGPALIALVVYVPVRAWQKWRQNVRQTSGASGLPNIEALVVEGIPAGCDVVAVSVSQYEQMLASLPSELHGECARQIARRLSVSATDSPIFDNDNGHFVWLVRPYSLEALVMQLEGLKALFASPLLIDGHVLDTNVHFGIDRNSESRPINRIKSAIASAAEAQAKGKLYEEFGRQRLAETPWELSLHARIDEGLRNGDIWLAYQPQLDLRRNLVCGAETLIRLNDPERGAIPPDAFILQAERAGRIDAITYWVLERAVHAANSLPEPYRGLQLSVNLSAWMVDQPGLVSHVSEIVQRLGYDSRLLTFEVTETFSMANRDQAKDNIAALRAMGFKLSIDDFGTGLASLAYLSEIPSDEIKLDKRFTQGLRDNARDRVIVRNTVDLAHELGQLIVAEGVEDAVTLELLRSMGCDMAQGYFIGRPMAFEDFLDFLIAQGPERRKYG